MFYQCQKQLRALMPYRKIFQLASGKMGLFLWYSRGGTVWTHNDSTVPSHSPDWNTKGLICSIPFFHSEHHVHKVRCNGCDQSWHIGSTVQNQHISADFQLFSHNLLLGFHFFRTSVTAELWLRNRKPFIIQTSEGLQVLLPQEKRPKLSKNGEATYYYVINHDFKV